MNEQAAQVIYGMAQQIKLLQTEVTILYWIVLVMIGLGAVRMVINWVDKRIHNHASGK